MSFLSRLLGTGRDPREALRPLWHAVVATSRTPDFYATHHVADSVEGRFDMIVHVLALTMLRMEGSPDLYPRCALLTELFVEDMDGQLRESGVGDMVVGKHMGRLMAALGGRLGALRGALADGDMARLTEALERNVTWGEAPDPAGLAGRFMALRDGLAASSDADLLAGKLPA